MALDIRDFAGFADGEDFQPAFRAALNALIAQGGGELVIPMPSGTDTYWIGRRESVDRPLAPDSGLDFTGVNVPIKIRGEGRRTRIGMLPPVDDSGSLDPTGDFYMFHFKRTHASISLDSLCLFGNKDAFPAGQNEHTHLVQIRHARDISFANVWFEEAWGDGIAIVGDIGDEDQECDRIKIIGCHFLHNGRGGVLFQRLARRIFLTHNYFDGGVDTPVEFEPSGGLGVAAPEQVVVAYNHIRNRHFDRTTGVLVPTLAPAMTLANGHKLAVIGNIIEGGTIFGQNVQEASIIGNHIDGVDCPRPGIHIIREVRDVSIIGNWVRVTVPEFAVKLEQNADLAPENVIIANNPHLEGRTGVNVVGACRRIKIHDNLIFGNSHSARGGGVGVNIDANTEEMDGINIHDNYIKGFPTGVQLARQTIGEKDGRIDRVRIRSNDIEDFTKKYNGVEIDPPNEFINILEFVP